MLTRDIQDKIEDFISNILEQKPTDLEAYAIKHRVSKRLEFYIENNRGNYRKEA